MSYHIPIMTEEVAQWLEIASEDIDLAEFLYEKRWPRPLERICFFCQQCAEKALKAFLIHQGIEPPRTHDIVQLSEACIAYGEQFQELVGIGKQLTPYAVQLRYPNEIEIDDPETAFALRKAALILETVKTQIKGY